MGRGWAAEGAVVDFPLKEITKQRYSEEHIQEMASCLVRSLLHLPAMQEAYLRRLLLRHQYSAAAAFADTLLQLAGVQLPSAS